MEAPSAPEPLPAAPEAQRVISRALLPGFVAAAGALVLVTWLGREILQGEIFAFDDLIRGAVPGLASPSLTGLMRAASWFGGPSVLIPLGVVMALAFLARGWRRGAILVIVTLAGAGLLNGLLKFSFARVRPAAFFDYPLPGSPSFPSGHALYAASVFIGLAALLSPRLKHPALRLGVWSVAIALVLLVGISRIYLGVHYPSDVLAGYSIGVIWVTAVAFGDRLARHRRRQRST
jgi:undecaprenyl-diphosphatase